MVQEGLGFQEFVLVLDPRVQFGRIRCKWTHFYLLVMHLFDKMSNLDSELDDGYTASPPFYRELAKRLPGRTTNVSEVIDYMQMTRTEFQVSRKDAILVELECICMEQPQLEKLLLHLVEDWVFQTPET